MDRMETATTTAPLRWMVVLCYGQAEWQVHTTLLAQGVRSFLPYTLGSARRGRWSHGVVKPQYPGYLFAALEDGVSTAKVKRVAGVYDFLRSGTQMVFMGAHQVASLKAQWLRDYRNTAPRLARKPVFAVGDWLAVPHGPFSGVPCQIVSIDKSGIICASIGQLQVSFHTSDAAVRSVRGCAEPARNTPKPPKPSRVS